MEIRLGGERRRGNRDAVGVHVREFGALKHALISVGRACARPTMELFIFGPAQLYISIYISSFKLGDMIVSFETNILGCLAKKRIVG